MNLSQHLKIGLCLAGLVAVSGLTGGLLGQRWGRHQMNQRNNPETWHEAATRTFVRTVHPTEQQGEVIQAHLNNAVTELKAIRADTILRSSNVVWRLMTQVERELTPEQLKAFEAMKPAPAELGNLDMLQVEPKTNK